MTQQAIIAVWGAGGTLGAEIARLGVAISFEVWGFTPTGSPPTDEPWIHGVRWATLEDAIPPGVTALVIADSSLPMPTGQADRTVLIESEAGIRAAGVFDVTLETAGVIVEQAAMAALRCAVEEDREGHYPAKEVAHIGDAMMIQ